MEDSRIVALYWERNERAISESDAKYGRLCRKIAYDILANHEDSEECVSDTYLGAWNSIPPNRPEKLGAYLAKICRNISLNLYEKLKAQKRGGGNTAECLDELSESVPSGRDVEGEVSRRELARAINEFLKGLPEDTRKIFVRRYWYMASIEEIADEYSFTQSKVKMTLLRTRQKLAEYLREEGLER